MNYVTDFGEYASLRGIDIMELPEGLRATSSDGGVYEITEGSWRHVGVSDPWVPDDDLSNYYRIDHDPLAPPFEYLGHVYAEGDEVEFLHEGRWTRMTYRIDGLRMYEPEVQAGPETLHTIDCHGVDPAIIQDYLDGYIAHGEAKAEAYALAGKVIAANDRALGLTKRHRANREALRAALDAVAQAAA